MAEYGKRPVREVVVIRSLSGLVRALGAEDVVGLNDAVSSMFWWPVSISVHDVRCGWVHSHQGNAAWAAVRRIDAFTVQASTDDRDGLLCQEFVLPVPVDLLDRFLEDVEDAQEYRCVDPVYE